MAITLNKLQALDQYANVEDFSEVFDIYTFPLIEYNNTPKIGAGIAGYSVYRNSANRELAVLFLLDVISAAGQSAMSDAGINYPSIRKDMQNTEAPWAAAYADYNMEAYIWGLEYTCATDYFLAHEPEYASDIMEAVQTMISSYCDGQKSLQGRHAELPRRHRILSDVLRSGSMKFTLNESAEGNAAGVPLAAPGSEESAVRANGKKPSSSKRFWEKPAVREEFFGYLFALPVILGLIIFTFIPAVQGFVYAFFNYNGFTEMEFVGLKNFVTFFTLDRDMPYLFRNTFTFAIINVPLSMVLGYVIALLVNTSMKGRARIPHDLLSALRDSGRRVGTFMAGPLCRERRHHEPDSFFAGLADGDLFRRGVLFDGDVHLDDHLVGGRQYGHMAGGVQKRAHPTVRGCDARRRGLYAEGLLRDHPHGARP